MVCIVFFTNSTESLVQAKRRLKPRAGFGPATTALPRRIHSAIDWSLFETWLRGEYRPKVARERLAYAKKYVHCLEAGNLAELRTCTENKRLHVLKDLSALEKFTGVHNKFEVLISDYGLTWAGKNADDIIIERLTKVVDRNEIFDWIPEVKQRILVYSNFMS